MFVLEQVPPHVSIQELAHVESHASRCCLKFVTASFGLIRVN